ncbi:hypothetical protein SAMN05518801_104139 [Novosphingobium sp. CF614]|uniref:hypothetical protein n=1 Tax=Novosphingobium sp. CF614 TaxID=1884364 RepID=UPI0008EE14DC|nr:hypothetical protein [Novosphingobium sp. CF614]SFF95603.1 hypothetical protein SAMN05518801_104139 [Novosphingobium sp. CF614]
MWYYGSLNMGEGIVGGSQVAMSTTQIYTCMGIAFINTRGLRGGLYHYPADAIGNANVADTIRQMYNDVAPDLVVVTPASDGGYNGSGSNRFDIEKVTDFLKKLGGATVTRAEPGNSAQLYWKNQQPVLNSKEMGGEDDREISTTVRTTMNSGGRQIEAGIWYYGGDGETTGVLDQGLTRRRSRPTCVIL